METTMKDLCELAEYLTEAGLLVEKILVDLYEKEFGEIQMDLKETQTETQTEQKEPEPKDNPQMKYYRKIKIRYVKKRERNTTQMKKNKKRKNITRKTKIN